MNRKLVSVIVPVYNVESYLEKCILSLVSQTYKNLEIILVDDGSTDKSSEICDEWALQDSRIRVIHKKNGGLSDARNAGLDVATGEYIAFVDSDDYIENNMISVLYEALIKHQADMAIGGVSHVGVNGDALDQYKVSADAVWDEQQFWRAFEQNYIFCEVVWNKLYQKGLFQDVRFPRGKIHEDEFVLHEIIDNCQRIATVSDVVYYYVQREDSITGNGRSLRSFDGVEAYVKRAKYLSDKAYYKQAEQTVLWAIELYIEIVSQLSDDNDVLKKRRLKIRKKIMHQCKGMMRRKAAIRFWYYVCSFCFCDRCYIIAKKMVSIVKMKCWRRND